MTILIPPISEAVFENASVNTLITLMNKSLAASTKVKIFNKQAAFPLLPDIQRTISQKNFIDDDYYISIFSSVEETTILDKIRRVSVCLETLARPCSGYNPYEVGSGVAPEGGLHTKQTVKDKPYHSEIRHDDQWKPEVIGRDLSRFHIRFSEKRWIKYGPWLSAARDPENFKGKRILVQEITGGRDRRIIAAYHDSELYYSRDIIPIKLPNETPDPLFLLGVINSKLISWYHLKCSPKAQKGLFPKVLVSDLKKLPISLGDTAIQNQISDAVRQVVSAKKVNPDADTIANEIEIDRLVYALYGLTDDEIAVVKGKE